MRVLHLVAAASAIAAATCACSPSDVAPTPVDPTGLSFIALGPESGITGVNVSGGPGKPFILESIGQGGAALDYDGDGRLDLFVANGSVYGTVAPGAEIHHALYRNLGGFRFEDVTHEAGLDFEGWAHGAWRVDFDADRRPDLYVTVSDGPNRFFRNAGGRFEDMTAVWGGADGAASTAAAFFDADVDGDLDLYVGNYVEFDIDSPPNGGQPCEWHGLRVFCGPQGLVAAPDSFWENRNGRLELATAKFGFGAVAPSYALGAVAADFDGDGDPDLYVANDSADSYYFENAGGGRFRESGASCHVNRNQEERAQASMGVAAGDFDRDGLLDLFVTTFSHDNDTLFRNVSSGRSVTSFEDVSFAAGFGLATRSPLSWGVEAADLDRDGWLDLVVASGHVYPQVDSVESGTTYAQRDQVFLNSGVGPGATVRFEERVPSPSDAFAIASVSRGLVTADLDEDGDSDFLVVELDARPTLIHNDSRPAGAWIGLRLIGAGANTEAIGARVWIEDSAGIEQVRERVGGGGYLSTSDARFLVGLGDARGPAKVTVRWPLGRTSVYEGLGPGRYHDLREP